MRKLMLLGDNTLSCKRTYNKETEPFWYSELVGESEEFGNLTVYHNRAAFDEVKAYMIDEFDQKEEERNSPCLPYFGYFSRDLAFIEEGPKYLNENSMINIDKLLKVGKVFEEIKLFQKYHYNFKIAFPFTFLSQLNPLDGDQLNNLSKSQIINKY